MTVLTQEERDDIAASTRVRHIGGKARNAFIAVAVAGAVISMPSEMMRWGVAFDMLDPKTMSETMKIYMGSGKGIGQAMYYMMIPYAVVQEYIMEKALKAKDYAKAIKDRSLIAGGMLMTAAVIHQLTHITGSGGTRFDPWDIAGNALGVTMAALAIKFMHHKALKPSAELDNTIAENIDLMGRAKRGEFSKTAPQM